MPGLAGLLLSLAWALAPDGHLVAQQLERSALAAPLAGLRPAVAGSWLVFHRQPAWAKAFYSPPEADLAAVERAAAEALAVPPRLLPRLRLPRIFLYAPYYGSAGELAELDAMAIDVAESFYHALVETHLDREARDPGSAYLAAARERAAELMSEVPEPQRLAAYLAAAADFGSHLLSIAHEIGRAESRARARGGLCALLDPPQTLFALWQASVETTPYRGRYTVLAAGGDAGGLVRSATTRRSLERRDKELFLREVLGGYWTGEAGRDFGHLCPRRGERQRRAGQR